jgi:hypothetical protein
VEKIFSKPFSSPEIFASPASGEPPQHSRSAVSVQPAPIPRCGSQATAAVPPPGVRRPATAARCPPPIRYRSCTTPQIAPPIVSSVRL